ncbi:hypothetical protein F0562_010199 [Nyssa sinensis]|uniref:FAD/NAD(P)-binding domain-containing protein n=1 Tax=Nyssa sinensis TaxID=561372 RepID=A0A5J5A126_9ASTE|nr:hypothetical protein F0562_010199 [Nyssa sinensis]
MGGRVSPAQPHESTVALISAIPTVRICDLQKARPKASVLRSAMVFSSAISSFCESNNRRRIFPITRSDRTVVNAFSANNSLTQRSLRFCGLKSVSSTQLVASLKRRQLNKVLASLSGNGTPTKGFDYDLVIIGAGVGGHGASLNAVEKGLRTAIIEGM